MQSPIKISGLSLIKFTHPCSNHCRFCSAEPKRLDNIPFERMVNVAERFIKWKDRTKAVSTISPRILYSHTLMRYKQSLKYRELCKKGGYNPLPLQMNGCIFMPEDDLEYLLREHMRAGYTSYMVTIAGNGEMHDKWVGRRGEFNYIFLMAKIAAKLGYHRIEKILLSQSSLPELQGLIEHLDTLKGSSGRSIIMVDNVGRGQNLEKERITREALQQLPRTILTYLNLDDKSKTLNLKGYKTEQEWIDWIRNNYSVTQPRYAYLSIRLDEDSIDRLETINCDTLYEEYLQDFMSLYRRIPEISVLCEMYGDHDNIRLYALHELERAWIMRYMKENSNKFPDEYTDYIFHTTPI
jgi:hypothetical protein